MTMFVWLGDEDVEILAAELFGVVFPRGAPVDVGHLLPAQVHRLRSNRYFREVVAKPFPEDDEADCVQKNTDKVALRQRLDELGAFYDGRWGVERLKEALEEAESGGRDDG